MIIKEEFLSRLRKIFDLNLYEAKIWTALLSRGVSTAGELSNISDVPRSRTYDILESLEKKGFILMKIGKPIKFVALKPEEVVERVKKNLIVNAHERSKRLEQLKGDEVLDELTSLFTNGVKFIEPSDLSGSLRGRQNMYNHLDMIIRSAEKTITLTTTAEGLNRKLEVLMPIFEKAKRRGVSIRIAAPITQQNYKIAKDLSRVAEVRDLSKHDLNGRFAIVDSKELMFMLLDDKSVHPNYDVAVWLSTDFFAKALEQMFEAAWNNFTPLNKLNFKAK
ncbi:MAG TPA: helix-turn-helix domain-containing protein [Candidatus Nanoarchaeia archaeon]|nr:helix-turn-helix domain-containing protein [Candidatus Nanoarchaeia archaeon]